MNAPNILITNYHCASNRGDAAILEGVVEGIQTEFPNAVFTVATEYPAAATIINNSIDSTEQRLVPFKPYHFRKNPLLGLFTANVLINRVLPRTPISSYTTSKLNFQPYLEADLIVATGGQYLTDNYMPSKLGALWELALCKLLGKPVVLYAQSIGPLNKQPFASIARRVFDKIDLITLRDSHSKHVLKSLGVSKTPMYVTADAAFSMTVKQKSDTPLRGRRIENPPSLDSHNPVVSISCRKWSYFQRGGQEKYEEAVAKCADWLIKERSARVVFISTCTGFDGYHTDDRVTAHSVIDRMNQKCSNNPQIVTGEYTPKELSMLYREVDIHVGTRMHSNILAILQETPVVGIEYEFKTKELMRQFDLEDYLVDIDQITPHSLIERMDQAFERQNSLSENIKNNLQTVQKDSLRNAELIAENIDFH